MLDRQNMNATVYSRKRPIEIVIVSAVMVVLALVRIWAHFSDPSSLGRLFDVYSVILSALLLSAAVGLWRVRRWGETVYRLLAIYMIGSGVVMIFASSAISYESLMFVGGYTIIMGACFSLVGIYIRRVLKRAGPQRGAV